MLIWLVEEDGMVGLIEAISDLVLQLNYATVITGIVKQRVALRLCCTCNVYPMPQIRWWMSDAVGLKWADQIRSGELQFTRLKAKRVSRRRRFARGEHIPETANDHRTSSSSKSDILYVTVALSGSLQLTKWTWMRQLSKAQSTSARTTLRRERGARQTCL